MVWLVANSVHYHIRVLQHIRTKWQCLTIWYSCHNCISNVNSKLLVRFATPLLHAKKTNRKSCLFCHSIVPSSKDVHSYHERNKPYILFPVLSCTVESQELVNLDVCDSFVSPSQSQTSRHKFYKIITNNFLDRCFSTTPPVGWTSWYCCGNTFESINSPEGPKSLSEGFTWDFGSGWSRSCILIWIWIWGEGSIKVINITGNICFRTSLPPETWCFSKYL